MRFRSRRPETTFERVIGSWLGLLAVTDAVKILAIFPTPAKSHFLFNEAVARSLWDAGHEVTIISPFANHELMDNYTAIDSKRGPVVDEDVIPIKKMKEISLLKLLSRVIDKEATYCRDVLQLPEVQVRYCIIGRCICFSGNLVAPTWESQYGPLLFQQVNASQASVRFP